MVHLGARVIVSTLALQDRGISQLDWPISQHRDAEIEQRDGLQFLHFSAPVYECIALGVLAT